MIRSWQAAIGLPVMLASLGASSTAFAQGNIFNPYGNSGYADYREFASPKYTTDPSLPGQARLQGELYGRNRANQFEAYTNSLEDAGANQSNGRLGAAGSTNYDRAEGTAGRAYRPNDTPADRLFRERRVQRDAAYNKALEEKDPRKRAYFMQQIDRESLDRPLGAVTRKLAAQATADRAVQAAAGRPVAKSGVRKPAPGTTNPPAVGASPATRGVAPAARRAGPATAPRTSAAASPAGPAAEPAAFSPGTPASMPITPPQ